MMQVCCNLNGGEGLLTRGDEGTNMLQMSWTIDSSDTSVGVGS